MAQTPKGPDLEAQRAAMKRLAFLVGKWSGEARILRGPGEFQELTQTEEAAYKLDGLILTIEGVGRAKSDEKVSLQAFGIIAYDDGTHTYRMRSFNDGRYAETEVKLLDDSKGMTWGFASGQMKTNSTLRITDAGEWTELTEITFGDRPPMKYLELRVRPRN